MSNNKIGRRRHIITNDELSVLKSYLETLDINLLESISNKTVAHTIDVIFKEAVRTWEQDDLSDGIDDEGNFTGCFQTDYELFNQELVFFGECDWSFPITIWKNKDYIKTNWEGHNYIYTNKNEYLDSNGRLCNFYQDIDIFGTEDTWKEDLIKALFMVVYEAYKYRVELISFELIARSLGYNINEYK